MNGVVAILIWVLLQKNQKITAVMAAKELRDYLENGNITHSVNYPACDMGISKAGRITICHKNIPKLLGQLTGACAAEGINIEDMTNKSKGDWGIYNDGYQVQKFQKLLLKNWQLLTEL